MTFPCGEARNHAEKPNGHYGKEMSHALTVKLDSRVIMGFDETSQELFVKNFTSELEPVKQGFSVKLERVTAGVECEFRIDAPPEAVSTKAAGGDDAEAAFHRLVEELFCWQA